MEFTVNLEQIVYICTLITAVWAVWKIVKEIRKPSDDVRAKLEQHDEFLDSDNKRLKKIEETNNLLLQCMFDLLNHNITGNGIETMKQTRDSLQKFLSGR